MNERKRKEQSKPRKKEKNEMKWIEREDKEKNKERS
jgi:hypothetical protein